MCCSKLSPNINFDRLLFRAERSVARLKRVEETLNDSLLIAMVLKGIPENVKYFSTLMMQQDVNKIRILKLKAVLRHFAENEKARNDPHNE